MTDTERPSAPSYVVLRRVGRDRWEVLGEFRRRPGQAARAARAQAIMDATDGKAARGDGYMAVLRSEWRIASDW